MKKSTFIIILVLCILLLPFGISQMSDSNAPLGNEQPQTQPQTIPSEVDRLPNLPESYDGHLLLKSKGYGACDTLTGNVMITMIMVEDDNSVWTADALENYKQKLEIATQKLMQDAGSFGADLNVIVRYESCRITGTVSMSDCQEWVNAALLAANLPTQNEVSPYLEQRYGVKEAPVFFCANYAGRSFAIEWDQGDYFEYGVLFSEAADYRHELNHLFGAIDFYFPDVVEKLSNQYLSGSIMSAVENQTTDSLTAYLIGWTDTLSAEARAFVDETLWITQEYLDEQLELETLTGHATIRFGNGTYTGDLVSGIPDGQGKILWDEGNTYEGSWVNGMLQGYGVYYWSADQCYYTGEWFAGQMHGYGSLTYADGSVKTGRWENGKFVGK